MSEDLTYTFINENILKWIVYRIIEDRFSCLSFLDEYEIFELIDMLNCCLRCPDFVKANAIPLLENPELLNKGKEFRFHPNNVGNDVDLKIAKNVVKNDHVKDKFLGHVLSSYLKISDNINFKPPQIVEWEEILSIKKVLCHYNNHVSLYGNDVEYVVTFSSMVLTKFDKIEIFEWINKYNENIIIIKEKSGVKKKEFFLYIIYERHKIENFFKELLSIIKKRIGFGFLEDVNFKGKVGQHKKSYIQKSSDKKSSFSTFFEKREDSTSFSRYMMMNKDSHEFLIGKMCIDAENFLRKYKISEYNQLTCNVAMNVNFICIYYKTLNKIDQKFRECYPQAENTEYSKKCRRLFVDEYRKGQNSWMGKLSRIFMKRKEINHELITCSNLSCNGFEKHFTFKFNEKLHSPTSQSGMIDERKIIIKNIIFFQLESTSIYMIKRKIFFYDSNKSFMFYLLEQEILKELKIFLEKYLKSGNMLFNCTENIFKFEKDTTCLLDFFRKNSNQKKIILKGGNKILFERLYIDNGKNSLVDEPPGIFVMKIDDKNDIKRNIEENIEQKRKIEKENENFEIINEIENQYNHICNEVERLISNPNRNITFVKSYFHNTIMMIEKFFLPNFNEIEMFDTFMTYILLNKDLFDINTYNFMLRNGGLVDWNSNIRKKFDDNSWFKNVELFNFQNTFTFLYYFQVNLIYEKEKILFICKGYNEIILLRKFIEYFIKKDEILDFEGINKPLGIKVFLYFGNSPVPTMYIKKVNNGSANKYYTIQESLILNYFYQNKNESDYHQNYQKRLNFWLKKYGCEKVVIFGLGFRDRSNTEIINLVNIIKNKYLYKGKIICLGLSK